MLTTDEKWLAYEEADAAATRYELKANIVYDMTLYCSTHNTAGNYGPFELQTVSSMDYGNSLHHIIYDKNPVFGMLHYGAIPEALTIEISRSNNLNNIDEVFTADIRIGNIP